MGLVTLGVCTMLKAHLKEGEEREGVRKKREREERPD